MTTATLSPDTLVFAATGVGSAGASCTSVTGSVLCVLVQGPVTVPGVAFGDGVRCVGPPFKRLRAEMSTGFVYTSSFSISAASAALGDPLSPGDVRHYFLWYRDPCPSFACPDPQTFNSSNSWTITWT